MNLYKLSLIRPKYILCFEVLAESNTYYFINTNAYIVNYCSKIFTIVVHNYKKFKDQLPKQ